MPQTEHLVIGSVPSTPRLHKHAFESPQLSLEVLPQKPGAKAPDRVKKVGLQAKSSKSTVPRSIPDDKEKTSDFSVRWELQLTAFVFVCFFIAIVIPLSMIIIGGIYVSSCPSNVMIPVFLIVCGSTFLTSVYGLRRLSRRNETAFDRSCYKATYWTSVLFQIGWFVAGCFWVYGDYEPNYDSALDTDYCNKTIYLYAFWLLNSVLTVLSLTAISFLAFLIFGREKAPSRPSKV